MALYINTNTSSLNAQRNLGKSTNALGRSLQRLSSGMRINSAKDDAAGLAITSRMGAQVRGLNQAQRNANDGISLMQTAEGALDETGNALQRIRELAVQASNATNTASDLSSISTEVTQLLSEISRVSTTTEFNNTSLLTGSFSAKKFQVGADKDQTISVSIAGANTNNLGINNLEVATFTDAEAAIASIDKALDSVSDIRSNLGALQNRFESVISNLSNVSENISAAKSRIMDADIATETATLTRNSILQQAGTAMLSQANQQPQLALNLLG